MISDSSQQTSASGIRDLVDRCGQNTGDSSAWSEFLRRFTPKIKTFIHSTLLQNADSSALSRTVTLGENDLFQSTVVKLVENQCSVLKRFTGETAEELTAYLAVITRSVVRDSLRRHRASKRPELRSLSREEEMNLGSGGTAGNGSLERGILAREIADLSLRAIKNCSGRAAPRDTLIFELYFLHGLSTAQISQCRAISLSRAGVQKVLKRVRHLVQTATATRGDHRAEMM